MTDREKWDRGVAEIQGTYAALSPQLKTRVNKCLTAIRSCKKTLHLIGEGAGAGKICERCGGECCIRGKNHLTAVDLLVYFNEGKTIFTPAFEQRICPYLGENGCHMGPEYRPYNCVTFICERVEDLLAPLEKERYYVIESELRGLYEDLKQLFDSRFRHAVLSVCERDPAKSRGVVLR
jgi:hypothetical protein